MRRTNTQNIGEILRELLKDMNIEHKLQESRIINSWEDLLGTKIARNTSNMYIKGKVLFVYLKSPVVRNELMMLKSSIVHKLNERAGAPIIDDIVFR
jgi:predicted nucleic acid-binding Zn ribbon protein